MQTSSREGSMGDDSWWDWRAEGLRLHHRKQQTVRDEERRSALEELAKRCVVLDNLASTVTPVTIKVALGQFGTVLRVKMVVNPANMMFIGAAIVEMESKNQREQVIRQLEEFLFMLGALPRPARAIPATPLMLIDHPWRRNPNRIKPRLVRKTDAPGSQSLWDREHQDRRNIDDNEHLQLYLENEEMKLAKTQEISARELVQKLNLITEAKKSGSILVVKRLHGVC